MRSDPIMLGRTPPSAFIKMRQNRVNMLTREYQREQARFMGTLQPGGIMLVQAGEPEPSSVDKSKLQ